MSSYFSRVRNRDASGPEPLIQPTPIHPYETRGSFDRQDPFADPDARVLTEAERAPSDRTANQLPNPVPYVDDATPAGTEPPTVKQLTGELDPPYRSRTRVADSRSEPLDTGTSESDSPNSTESNPVSPSVKRADPTVFPAQPESQTDPVPAGPEHDTEPDRLSIEGNQNPAVPGRNSEVGESDPLETIRVSPTQDTSGRDRTSWQNRFDVRSETPRIAGMDPTGSDPVSENDSDPDEPLMVSPSVRENFPHDDETPPGDSPPNVTIDRINVTVRKHIGVQDTTTWESHPEPMEDRSRRTGWSPKIRYGLGQL